MGIKPISRFPPLPPQHSGCGYYFSRISNAIRLCEKRWEGKKRIKKQFTTGREKTDLISSYSDKNIEMGRDGKRVRHVCFLLLTELFVMREWGGRGWESGDKWLQCVWGAAVTQEAAQPNFFHSCTAGSENLICKLPKARQEALISAPKPLTAKKTTSK